MTHLLTTILAAVLLHSSSQAEAAYMPPGDARPTRGNYKAVHDEETMRRKIFTTAPEKVQEQWTIFSSDQLGVKLSVPSSWKTENHIDTIIAFTREGEKLRRSFMPPIAWVSIHTENAYQKLTLDQLDNKFLADTTVTPEEVMGTYIPDFSLTDIRDGELFAHPAHIIRYTAEIGSKKYQVALIHASLNGQYYKVRFTVAPDVAEKYQPLFERIQSSLALVPRAAAGKDRTRSKILRMKKPVEEKDLTAKPSPTGRRRNRS